MVSQHVHLILFSMGSIREISTQSHIILISDQFVMSQFRLIPFHKRDLYTKSHNSHFRSVCHVSV